MTDKQERALTAAIIMLEALTEFLVEIGEIFKDKNPDHPMFGKITEIKEATPIIVEELRQIREEQEEGE